MIILLLCSPQVLALSGPASCEADGIFYVAGGESTLNTPAEYLFAYDPKTDTWTRKKDMPTARCFAAASAVDGVVYVIGGGNVFAGVYTKVVEAYDPKTDTWTTKASLPTARLQHTACTLDGRIYVIGGYITGEVKVATVECYDPKADQWTQKASLPVPVMFPVAQVVNGKMYVFSSDGTFGHDPGTDRWTRMASLSATGFDCHGSAAGTVDGVAYLFGGMGLSDPYCAHALALAYDPIQDGFVARRKIPQPCMCMGFATIGGRIYVAGGASGNPYTRPGFTYYKSLWVFDPQGGVYPRILSVTRPSNDTVRLVWQGETNRLYSVETTLNPASRNWVQFKLSTGATIQATNDVVEATGTVSPADMARFFRVIEAN